MPIILKIPILTWRKINIFCKIKNPVITDPFLVQNMFPVNEYYIDHIHTKKDNPVPVKKELQHVIQKNVKSFLVLNNKGIKVTFTDITRLRELMLAQPATLQHETITEK